MRLLVLTSPHSGLLAGRTVVCGDLGATTRPCSREQTFNGLRS
jgi:hypothetical protein